MSDATAAYRAARDWLLDTTRSYEDTVAEFRFPQMPDPFNWVSDWFDVVAEDNDERALVVVEEDGSSTAHTFAELRARSLGVSAWLAGLGVRRGDSVIVMLGNRVELWESMLGDHAARSGRDADHHRGRPGRAGRPDRAGSGAARDRGRRGHGQVRRRTGRLHADQRRPDRRRSGGLAHLRRRVRRRPGRRRPRRHGARRPAAALLHVRHHEPAQAGRAHAGLLPRRPPVDDVLARRAPGRRAPQHLLRRLGQARVVVLLRTVDRGGDDRGAELRPLRRRRPCCGGCASSRSPRSARRRRSGGC